MAPDRPRNEEEKEAMRYSSTTSMLAYIKLPQGRPTNHVIPTAAITVVLGSTATLASNVSPAPAPNAKAKAKFKHPHEASIVVNLMMEVRVMHGSTACLLQITRG